MHQAQRHRQVIIVGGGPAGSTCAWQLKKAGFDVLILEATPFPRTKLCAGWITRKVMDDLQFGEADYPGAFSAVDLRYHWPKIPFAIPNRSAGKHNFSIRRIEFDAWLLQRSGAAVDYHQVKHIEQKNGEYHIDGIYSCDYLIGAGGTACPVRRTLFPDSRSKSNQVATLEKEFYYPQRAEQTHLFFSHRGLDGYSWYFPKADGYLNIGLGAFSYWLKQNRENIHRHFDLFVQDLVRLKLLDSSVVETLGETGHPYYVAGDTSDYKKQNCYLIGDAIGLSTHDLAEGIGPAVESALAVAAEIAGSGYYDKRTIPRYSFDGVSRFVLRKKRPFV